MLLDKLIGQLKEPLGIFQQLVKLAVNVILGDFIRHGLEPSNSVSRNVVSHKTTRPPLIRR